MSKKIDTVFVLALLTLFAATAFLLVLIGAKQYRYVTDSMNENYEDRTVSSYLTEKIRQNDTENAIAVVRLEDTTALSITSEAADIQYITYIYYYEGSLRELVVTGNSVFTFASGQEIIALQGFTPSIINDSLLHISLTDTSGDSTDIYLSLHCDSRKEAP